MRGEVYILETDMFDTSHGGNVASGCAVNRTPRQALYRRKKFNVKKLKKSELRVASKFLNSIAQPGVALCSHFRIIISLSYITTTYIQSSTDCCGLRVENQQAGYWRICVLTLRVLTF